MPLYEYECSGCGETFEKMVRFSEADSKPPCPKCDGKDTRKRISRVAAMGFSLAGGTASGGSASSCGSGGGFR